MPGPGGHHGGGFGGPRGGGFGGPGGHHGHRPPMGGGMPPMGGRPPRRRGCCGCLLPVLGIAAVAIAAIFVLLF